jgi:hypothetical protein
MVSPDSANVRVRVESKITPRAKTKKYRSDKAGRSSLISAGSLLTITRYLLLLPLRAITVDYVIPAFSRVSLSILSTIPLYRGLNHPRTHRHIRVSYQEKNGWLSLVSSLVSVPSFPSLV